MKEIAGAVVGGWMIAGSLGRVPRRRWVNTAQEGREPRKTHDPPKKDAVTMPARSASFSVDSSAPAAARAVVIAFLGSSVAPDVVADALLLTSELVSNSVRHAGLRPADLIEMELRLDDHRLRVTIADTDGAFETRRRPSDDPGGWGLALVGRVASRWDIVRNEPNAVWFELDH